MSLLLLRIIDMTGLGGEYYIRISVGSVGLNTLARLVLMPFRSGLLLFHDLPPYVSQPLTAFLFVIIVTVAGYLIVLVGSRVVSNVMSQKMNAATWKQVRRLAYGNDTIGEASLDSLSQPDWLSSKTWVPIPGQLGDEITTYSDQAAATAVSKFRAGIGELAFAAPEAKGTDVFADYLTWDELIHTSYFNVPRFRKLVAYAISEADGFRATGAFEADPDYTLVAKWYVEIAKPGHA